MVGALESLSLSLALWSLPKRQPPPGRPPLHHGVDISVGLSVDFATHIKAIITAEEVLLRDPTGENVILVVEELQRRLPPANAIGQGQGDGKEYPSRQNDIEADEEDESPFEFRALEVALEAICSFLAARTMEQETTAYPAVDELTSKDIDFVMLTQLLPLWDRKDL